MIGIGTIVNTISVFVGSILGLFLKKGINENLKIGIIHTLGICVMLLGLTGALEGLIVIEDGVIKSANQMPLIICLVVGTIIGEIINIEKGTQDFALFLKEKFSEDADGEGFMEGFIVSTMVVCVGAMSIVGAMKDALFQDPSILYAKSILDTVFCTVFASIYGKGVIFSALALGIYQGAITLFASFLNPFITDAMIFNISYVGSVLIFALGINLVFDTKIRVSNMIPAIIVALFYQ